MGSCVPLLQVEPDGDALLVGEHAEAHFQKVTERKRAAPPVIRMARNAVAVQHKLKFNITATVNLEGENSESRQ